MFDYGKERERLYEEYRAMIQALDFADDCLPAGMVRHVSDGSIFLEHTSTKRELNHCVHKIRKAGDYKLDMYYMNYDGALALCYRADGLPDIYAFTTDVDATLFQVSGGTCRVEEIGIRKKHVVCEVAK